MAKRSHLFLNLLIYGKKNYTQNLHIKTLTYRKLKKRNKKGIESFTNGSWSKAAMEGQGQGQYRQISWWLGGDGVGGWVVIGDR